MKKIIASVLLLVLLIMFGIGFVAKAEFDQGAMGFGWADEIPEYKKGMEKALLYLVQFFMLNEDRIEEILSSELVKEVFKIINIIVTVLVAIAMFSEMWRLVNSNRGSIAMIVIRTALIMFLLLSYHGYFLELVKYNDGFLFEVISSEGYSYTELSKQLGNSSVEFDSLTGFSLTDFSITGFLSSLTTIGVYCFVMDIFILRVIILIYLMCGTPFALTTYLHPSTEGVAKSWIAENLKVIIYPDLVILLFGIINWFTVDIGFFKKIDTKSKLVANLFAIGYNVVLMCIAFSFILLLLWSMFKFLKGQGNPLSLIQSVSSTAKMNASDVGKNVFRGSDYGGYRYNHQSQPRRNNNNIGSGVSWGGSSSYKRKNETSGFKGRAKRDGKEYKDYSQRKVNEVRIQKFHTNSKGLGGYVYEEKVEKDEEG